MLLEAVENVSQRDEAVDDVLVFRCVHVVAQLVGASQSLASNPRGEPMELARSDFFGGILGVAAEKHKSDMLSN